jgi:hypothetical protein
LEAAGQNGGSTGRLFVVRLDALDYTSWPDAFSDLLGFQFFEQANPDAPARTLGTPLADDPRDRLYFQRLDDLSSELADRLHEMKSAQEMPAQSPDSPDTSDSLSAEDSPTVFLAEATPDLDDLRDNLRRHLKQLNIRVLPERHYDRAPDAFRAAMESDLEQSLLFVQLLGQYVTLHTDDLPKGYEGLQLDIAEEKDIPILRWHSQELDTESVRDPELLKRAEVIVAPFEEFKTEVAKKTRALESQRTPPVLEGNGAYILLNANSRDEQIVQTISQALEQQGIGYDTADENEDISALTEDDDFQGLLIIYGECEQQWAKQQVRSCRQLLLRKKQRAPLCAVYLGPPDEKLPLGIKPPNMSFVTHQDDTALSEFFVLVRAKVIDS